MAAACGLASCVVMAAVEVSYWNRPPRASVPNGIPDDYGFIGVLFESAAMFVVAAVLVAQVIATLLLARGRTMFDTVAVLCWLGSLLILVLADHPPTITVVGMLLGNTAAVVSVFVPESAADYYYDAD